MQEQENDVFYELTAGSPAALAIKSLPGSQMAQSWLLCSPDTDALLYLARFLIKNDSGGRENSADIIYFNEDKILTADIEKIISTANMTPLELDYKYYILKNGGAINDSAANKLLKTLEEPPDKIKIIILAEDEYSVLPTVRSRCRVQSLAPFPANLLSEAADRAYGERTKSDLSRIKRLALGSITRLKKAAAGDYDEVENTVLEILIGLKSSVDQAKNAFLFSKLKNDLNQAIDFFELAFSDALRLCYDKTPVLEYKTEQLKTIADFYGAEAIIRLKPLLEKTRVRLRFSGNTASIIDEFLFSLLEIRQKCRAAL